MKPTISSLFQQLPTLQDDGLKRRILAALAQARVAEIRQKRHWQLFGLWSSTGVFFVALVLFGNTLLHSEFWNLVELLFTDSGTVWSYGGDFLFSLLETFPAVPLMMLLLPAMVLLFLFREWLSLEKRQNLKMAM